MSARTKKKPVLILREGEAPPYQRSVVSKLLRCDFKSTPTLVSVFPLVPGKGKTNYIPNHILGIDTNFENVIEKINQYRRMTTSEQENECQRFQGMKRFERRIYATRIDELEQQKKVLKENLKSQVRNTTPPSNNRMKRKIDIGSVDQAAQPDQPNQAAQTDQTRPTRPNQCKNPASVAPETVCEAYNFAPLTQAEHEFFHPPKRQRVIEPKENQPETDLIGESGNRTVGLFSPDAERRQLLDANNPVGKNPHLQGEHARTVRQQNDARSREDVNSALKSVATAMDTSFFPGRISTKPTVRMVFLMLREVENTGSGNVSAGNLRMKKPELTVLVHSPRDLKPVMYAYKKTLRDKSGEFDFLPLIAEHNFVAPVVNAHIQSAIAARKEPSQTPRTYHDVMEEVPK